MKIKILFTFYILTFISVVAKSQSNQGSINKIDELGQKQGYWKNYELKMELQYIKCDTFENKCETTKELRYFIQSEGVYLNNQKVGHWSMYSNCQNSYNKIEKSSHITSLDSLSQFYNSIIVGQAFILNDTINIYCKDDKCNFSTTLNRVFIEFELSSLNEKLKKLTNCEYNLAIKKSQYFYTRNADKKNKAKTKPKK